MWLMDSIFWSFLEGARELCKYALAHVQTSLTCGVHSHVEELTDMRIWGCPHVQTYALAHIQKHPSYVELTYMWIWG